MSKEKNRMKELLEGFENPREIIKKSTNSKINKNKLDKENNYLKKLCNYNPSLNEFYDTFSSQSVSSIANNFDNVNNVTKYPTGQKIQADEALELAIKRVLKSGAPLNNLTFYDEVNWNLQSLGFDAKDPIDIKEAINNILK